MQTSPGVEPANLSRIVLADDDEDDRQFFEEALSDVHPNAVLTTAKDGEELIFILKNYHTPELIFLDLNMPRKNGIECLREIRSNTSLQNIR
jgi:CheY-like chemotaxis protein